jgi:hypothetical protein
MMESAKRDVKTKKIPGRNSQSNGQNDRQGLGEFAASSFVDGVGQQNRFISGNCQENDSSRIAYSQGEEFNTGSNSGKILEEVLLLKQQFLDYVKLDQARLEARLDESKKQEQSFLANAEVIEKRLRTALLTEELITEDE